MGQDSNDNSRSVGFTVDGRQLEVKGAKQVVSEVLRLAGLDPNGYNLGEIRGGRPGPKMLDDGQTITIKDGDEFISVREEATVA